jgi:cephalosporin hydroxylase
MVRPNTTGHRKDVPMLREYFELFKVMNWPRRIIEFGVDKGGSLLFWNDLFAPDIILGFDHTWPPESFFEKAKGLPIQVKHFNQLSRESIEQAASEAQEIASYYDFMVDDCAHNADCIAETITAFWPMLINGGTYVIEDWQTPDGAPIKQRIRGIILDADIYYNETFIALKKW